VRGEWSDHQNSILAVSCGASRQRAACDVGRRQVHALILPNPWTSTPAEKAERSKSHAHKTAAENITAATARNRCLGSGLAGIRCVATEKIDEQRGSIRR
jgi:hypothetical protein